MGPLGSSRSRIEAAISAHERVERAADDGWSDAARRRFDAEIVIPLAEAINRYARTLADLDVAAGRTRDSLNESAR